VELSQNVLALGQPHPPFDLDRPLIRVEREEVEN